MANKKFKARKLVPGKAVGPALVTRERVMFLGFTDPKQGIFHAPQTELQGKSFKGVVLIYTSGKASSGGARAIDLAVRAGNAPAAIVNLEVDPITVAGCALDDGPSRGVKYIRRGKERRYSGGRYG
ncbi:hypothetical protein ES703_71510 [subsurface metagenome]